VKYKEGILKDIIKVLVEKEKFLLLTHKDPDLDGIGSMIALGRALSNAGKTVTLFTETSLEPPLSNIKGSESIVYELDPKVRYDATIILDCSDLQRLGIAKNIATVNRPLINIDHHETNDFFGDFNFVVTDSSSTGELVFRLIKQSTFSIDFVIAEDLFAAIQADTGCFKYENTTKDSFIIAAELLEYGISPWDIYRNTTEQYTLPMLKLLEMSLSTIETYYDGKLSIMSITYEMVKKAGAYPGDSERFITYPRFLVGVEIATLIRQIGDKEYYKFSLRSNGRVNVAKLASNFGGGGHARAAGFECKGDLYTVKKRFMEQVLNFLKK